MHDAAGRLRTLLEDMGAATTSDVSDGAFRDEVYTVRGIGVRISSEYGNARVNLSCGSVPSSPASFWLAALDGAADYPDPAVTEEDMESVLTRLPELAEKAPQLSPTVAAMHRQYIKATKERLQG